MGLTATRPGSRPASTVNKGAATAVAPMGPVVSRKKAAVTSSSTMPGSASRRRSGPCLNTKRVCGPAVTRTVPVCRSTLSAVKGPIANGPRCFGSSGRGRDWRVTAVTTQSDGGEPAGNSMVHSGLSDADGRVMTGVWAGPTSVAPGARSALRVAVAGASTFQLVAGPRSRNFAVVSTTLSVKSTVRSSSADWTRSAGCAADAAGSHVTSTDSTGPSA